MSRDHDFETKMREAYAGTGQVGLSRVAREEHNKVLHLEKMLREIHDWMDDADLGSHGSELHYQIGKWFGDVTSEGK